jgi:hypothetical protein
VHIQRAKGVIFSFFIVCGCLSSSSTVPLLSSFDWSSLWCGSVLILFCFLMVVFQTTRTTDLPDEEHNNKPTNKQTTQEEPTEHVMIDFAVKRLTR